MMKLNCSSKCDVIKGVRRTEKKNNIRGHKQAEEKMAAHEEKSGELEETRNISMKGRKLLFV